MKIKLNPQTACFLLLLLFTCCGCNAVEFVQPVKVSNFSENFNDSIEIIDTTVEMIPVLPSFPESSSKIFGDFGKLKECEGDYGCHCNRTHPCDQERNLECVDDTCVCMNPLHRIYDENQEECVIIVDAPCSENSGPRCIPNAKCFLKSCRCHLTFSPANESTKCLLNAYEYCEAHECNIEKGLGCKNNMCQCMDSLYIYSAVASRCISPDQTIKKFARTAGATIVEEVADGTIRHGVNIIIHFLSLPWKMFSAFG